MKRKKQPFKWLVAGGIVAVAIFIVTTLNFGNSLVYFYTPSEAVAQALELSAKDVRIGAMVKPGSVVWDADKLDLNFVMTDLKEHEISVSYKGAPPDMFKEGQGVVVEGRLASDGKSFASKKLLVKHSEEYKKEDDHSSMNKMLLEESIFKD